MRKGLTAAAIIITSLACGGGATYENKAACVRFVEKVNGLECFKMAQLDAGQMCSDSLDMTPCDMTGYYDCMADKYECDGAMPKMGDLGSCSPGC